MSSETSDAVSEEVKNFVNTIIKQNNLNPISEIKYGAGSEIGAGYMSNTISVDIKSGAKTVNLFLKCILSVKSTEMSIDKLFANEVYFYEYIYPIYVEFSQKRGIEDGFRNVPKCYGVIENIIALENLKDKGFELFAKGKLMNDKHIEAVFKSFAQFHAISFAFKEQEKEKYEDISNKLYNFEGSGEDSSFINGVKGFIKSYMGNLDPEKDEHALKKLQTLHDEVFDILLTPNKLNEAAIITKGDCWNNNTMFLYENQNKDSPSDIMQVDWQMVKACSPVFDISFCLYPIASEEVLNNLQHFLKVYHAELSHQIRQLGSDPEILYPYTMLMKQWKQYSRYGYALSFLFCKMNLAETEEAQTYEELGEINVQKMNFVNQSEHKENIYINRMTVLTKHMIENDFL